MNVCVYGLWHLGVVTAVCLAKAGHDVVGLDLDPGLIRGLNNGCPPVLEPGLQEILGTVLANGRLRFTVDAADAVEMAEIVWVTFDTPVDENDCANIDFVVERTLNVLPHLRRGSLVLVSSQVPVGTTRRIESIYREAAKPAVVSFAYLPENLRLGKALETFTRPDRFVVGADSAGDRSRISELLAPFTHRFEWMSVESAEMTKHAINAFLAASVVFINEISSLCEMTGADAKEVERGLKTESRIGPKAYLSPGSSFAGGTLARDVMFLKELGTAHGIRTDLFTAILSSNDAHRSWVQEKLRGVFGDLSKRSIAVWGLSYKVGTDTLRRSSSIELCSWLAKNGAEVHAHDPVVRNLPEQLARQIRLHVDPLSCIANVDAVVVSTGWPDYSNIAAEQLARANSHLVVFDPNRVLAQTVRDDGRFRYFAVGKVSS